MKKIYAAVLTVLMSGLAIAEAGITITETVLPNGDSSIEVINPTRGITRTYNINLSTHHSPATSPDDPVVQKYESWKFGAFLCYNSNQYSGTEFCSSTDPVNDFDPTNLDVEQWITTIKNAGMKYAVLTVRHTSEFLLWDSITSEINVMNSSYQNDLVQEYVDQCRQQGIAVGIYYCLWGGQGWRPDPNARAIILAQLHELATQYGEIDYFWLDMPSWSMWLTPDLSQQEIYDSLKNINSESVVMFNHGIQDGTNMAYTAYPTDVVNGELHQPPAAGHDPYRVGNNGVYYAPFEYEPCSQKRGGYLGGWGASWFTYGSGMGFEPSEPFPAEFLYRRIASAYERRTGGVLLSCAPDYTGSFRQEDVDQLVRLGDIFEVGLPDSVTLGCGVTASSTWSSSYVAEYAFDGNTDTRWGGGVGSTSGWLEVDLGQERTFSKLEIQEGWDRVTSFQLQVKVDDVWQTIHEGTTIGIDYVATFNEVTARQVRLNIPTATDVPTIWEIYLYDNAANCAGNAGRFDVTGPDNVPDCKVDIFDFAAFLADWLNCNLVPDCLVRP